MSLTDDLIRTGRAMSEKGVVSGCSGNVSIRLQPDSFLISRSGSDLGRLCREDLVRCEVDRDEWHGDVPPSIEAGLHRSIYLSCEEAVAVAHSHPFFSTLVACSQTDIRPDLLPETMAYVERVERVPYHHAGSQDLAGAVAEAARASQVILLENHGVVCWGRSLDEAVLKMETLELLCRLTIMSRSANISLNYLGGEVMSDFLQHLKRIGKSA